jgi:hypothetical protein
MSDERCETCRFWFVGEVVTEGATAGRAQKEHQRPGGCRRHAPRPLLIPAGDDNGKPYRPAWPQTAADEWCGEFQPRTPLPTTRPPVVPLRRTFATAEDWLHVVEMACRRRVDEWEWSGWGSGPARRSVAVEVKHLSEYHLLIPPSRDPEWLKGPPPADAEKALDAIAAVDLLAAARLALTKLRKGTRARAILELVIAANSPGARATHPRTPNR